MVTAKNIGVIYGSQHIAKGINMLLAKLDELMGKAGAPVLEKPSTWVTIAASAGIPIATMILKPKDPLDKIALLIGGYLSTNLWNIIEQITAAPAYAPAAVAIPPPAVAAPPITGIGPEEKRPPTF